MNSTYTPAMAAKLASRDSRRDRARGAAAAARGGRAMSRSGWCSVIGAPHEWMEPPADSATARRGARCAAQAGCGQHGARPSISTGTARY